MEPAARSSSSTLGADSRARSARRCEPLKGCSTCSEERGSLTALLHQQSQTLSPALN